MRALKLLTSFVTWRWTPCIGLITSSLLYVVIVVLVTPKTFSFGGGPKAVNVIEGAEPANAMTAPRADRAGAAARRPTPTAPTPSPGILMAPAPVQPPPTPAEEPRRPETPPPAVAPPPAPPPNTDQAGEDDEAPAAPPPPAPAAPNPNARFMATPLRFLPQLASAAGAAQPPPPPPAEDH